ncbi:AsmA family protein [Devosia sp. MC532]|uniref:AsmA family protein n=1 Tax=Devosia sp. MC532 TaxID=2799788 RepID=UPI0018F28D43|nr:AsmA family protein [Devosia sp. MC532]MBJ7578540.1 AsmA family protein [Devosia sp. MC532]
MKKTAIVVGLLFLTLLGLVFLLPFAVSSTALRTALADQLSRASGATIALNGPLQFSIVPEFGIVVEDFSFAAEDGSLSMTAARSVASVAPLSLLSGQIKVTGIEIKNPRIVLSAGAGETVAVPQEPSTEDIFQVLAGYLEKISIDHIGVIDGEVVQDQAGTLASLASAINLKMSFPSISAPVSVAVSGVMDGNKLELGAEIGSLRDLLARQPATFAISVKASQPLHPALADVKASGNIQLADDGSYRVTGGEIDSIGQKMLLDASYVPGEQPVVIARVKAGVLSYADFQPVNADPAPNAAPSTNAAASAPDLSALKALDADIELHAEAIQVGDAVARDVVIAAQLQNGRLVSTVDSTSVAGGSLVASVALDANDSPSVASGSVNLTSIDIEQLTKLLGQKTPVTGRLSSELQYAFKGLDGASIRNSLNLRGSVSIAGGSVAVPQLVSIAGQGAGVVDALEANVQIDDIRQPVSASGSARWNGEAVSFAASVTPTQFLWEEPGAVAFDLKSQPLNANFSGTVTPSGQVSGKADIATPSMTRALAWLGQSVGSPLGQFAFSGGVSAGGNQFAVTDATIRLDDIRANGSVSVAMASKPSVTASLSVDTLDLRSLVGGGGSAPAAAASGPSPIDLSMLRLFNADIRFAANQLAYGDVKLGPTTATLSVAEGVAKLNIPQAGFYNGVVAASVTANGAGSVPAIDLTASMENVQALPLLTDAAGFDKIEGQLQASVQVSGAGADSQAFARSLNGPVNVVVSNGAIRGIDVAGLVRNVRSLIDAGYTQDAEAKTEFTELSVNVNIANGVATAETIRVLGPFVRMSGAGSVDLAAQTIDMRLDPRVVGSLDGQGGDFDVSGLGMPIIINGPLSGPRIYPDLTAVLSDPNRALQALSQLGVDVGGLTGGASGVLDGIGSALGGEAGGLNNEVLTNAIGQMIGGQGLATDPNAPPSQQSILNSVLGNVLGQQAPTTTPAPTAPLPAPMETITSPAQQPVNIALPRPDPRGPAPVVPSTPAPAAPPTPQDIITDFLAPQAAPQPEQIGRDALEGLINQLGL